MKHWLITSFRNRLFAAIMAASLIPLVLCIGVMVQMIRLRLDARTQEEVSVQCDEAISSLDTIADAIENASAAWREKGEDCAEWDDALSMNAALFNATEQYRNLGTFDLYDAQGISRYTTRDGAAAGVLPTDWGVLYGASRNPGKPYYYAMEPGSDADAPLLLAAVELECQKGGYLVMQLSSRDLERLLEAKYPEGSLALLDRFFRPLTIVSGRIDRELMAQMRRELLSGENHGADRYVYHVEQHVPTGLFLLIRQARAFNMSTIRTLTSIGVMMAIFCIGLSAFMGLKLSRQISSPMEELREAFDHLEQDDLDTQAAVNSQDELGELVSRFNDMVTALRQNREELLHNQQDLKEAQIRMMQAQLNPHFLCNTLDTMKWISKINKVPQVADMSTNLADILRFCISAEEFVPLYREVEILERYMDIQRIRLSGHVDFALEIPEELYDCMVPKMILQPIVENAILHGLAGMDSGRIRVRARMEGEWLKITVTDNGKGFPQELAGRPYRRDKNLAKGHLGLYNVDTILMRYYGEDCGLYLDAGEDGIGASVTATLPIQFEEDGEC